MSNYPDLIRPHSSSFKTGLHLKKEATPDFGSFTVTHTDVPLKNTTRCRAKSTGSIKDASTWLDEKNNFAKLLRSRLRSLSDPLLSYKSWSSPDCDTVYEEEEEGLEDSVKSG